ncbi:MAG: S8 family serine peptidase [Actinomycetota bacterium]|nr:S8 family serine peptidase [Actinomycetota bacterium]
MIRHRAAVGAVAAVALVATVPTTASSAAPPLFPPVAAGDTDPDEPGAAVRATGRIRSEGFERIGADAIQPLAADGRGVVIAVLDLGFGASRIPALQRRRELPPSGRLETMSFDPTWGLAGRNAYGNATNHGELVAQTVYDFAPAARYLFVNYHTEDQFLSAVDWLIQRRPDVVVHSNSFIEGTFDGDGAPARAVDRAAEAGIAWVNSAGNYAQRHWEGSWADADDDDVLDWPVTPGWTFPVDPDRPITFALSWEQDEGAEVTDLDLVLQKRDAAGNWFEVAASRDSQQDGARASERVTGVPSGDGGEFRLRVVLASGPPPPRRLTLFSREIPMSALGDPAPGSVPTPGDAEGSITVGAVGWTSNGLKAYSSRGPTDDGRMKPDITAPTNTRVLTATGPRAIGGTSNAAPNAAGAIALIIGARKMAGAPLTVDQLRDLLATQALDLGAPGPDDQFGAGRIRVDVDPPRIALTRRPARLVRKLPVRLGAQVDDASRLTGWTLHVDGRRIVHRGGERPPSAALGRRWLPDGRHVIELRASDWPGNVGVRRMKVLVDTRAPRLRSFRVERVGRERAVASGQAARRPARAVLVASDVSASRIRVVLRARDGREVRRQVRFRGKARRVLGFGSLPPGRYTATITASDAVGHNRTVTRVVRLRP